MLINFSTIGLFFAFTIEESSAEAICVQVVPVVRPLSVVR